VLIHPWDAVPEERWRGLLTGPTFGQLVTAGLVDGYPVVVPTHFTFDGDRTVLLHLARPNPVWKALESDPAVVLSVATSYAYVEAAWNADEGTPPELGVPTSYYTAVQLRGHAEVVDDPEAKAMILRTQLAHLEPPGSTRNPVSTEGTDGRLLPGIRGIRIDVREVLAKTKYGGNKSVEHRRSVAARLRERGQGLDEAAADQVVVSPTQPGMGQA
jgi:transcriptional regulator